MTTRTLGYFSPRRDITTYELAHLIASNQHADPVRYLERECPTAFRHCAGDLEKAADAQRLYDDRMRAAIQTFVDGAPLL